MNFITTALKKVLHIPEDIPQFAQIAVTTYCNLDCPMCPRNYGDLDIKHIEFDNFIKIIDKLDGVKSIALVGLGEPLMYPRIFDAIELCKSKGFEVQFTTNGLLLNNDKKIDQLILSKLDRISFSLESTHDDIDQGHSNNLDIMNNIMSLMKRRDELNFESPKITLQPVLFKDKEQNVYDVIEWGASIGVDRINIPRVDMVYKDENPGLERPDVEEEKKISKVFAMYRKKYKMRIDFQQDQVFIGFKGFLYKYLKYFLRLDSYCYRFQDFVFITQDGDVQPCCYAEKQMRMGNILVSSLAEVWHGDKYKYIRKNQNEFSLCQRCDNHKLKQIV